MMSFSSSMVTLRFRQCVHAQSVCPSALCLSFKAHRLHFSCANLVPFLLCCSRSSSVNVPSIHKCDDINARNLRKMDVSSVLVVLDKLTCSKDVPKIQDDASQSGAYLDTLLKQNLHSTLLFIQSDKQFQPIYDIHKSMPKTDEAIQWYYANVNLEIVHFLTCTLIKELKEYKALNKLSPDRLDKAKESDAPPISPDTLSFSQQKALGASLQFIVTLGICPYLLPGVGVSLDRRSGFSHMIRMPSEEKLDSSNSRLRQVCHRLLECTKVSSIGSLLLTRHLGDILAALLQICHSPHSDKSPEELTGERPGENGNEVPELGYFMDQLKILTHRVFQPILVRELLMLQGGASPPSGNEKLAKKSPVLIRAPVWLRLSCGQLLSERLLQPKGVHSVLGGILNIGSSSGQSANVDLRKCDAAAQIIATCPKNISLDNYYKVISPQVIELIQCSDKLVAAQYLRVAVGVMSSVLSRHPDKADVYFFRPILKPLYACLDTNFIESPPGEPSVYVGEDSFTVALDCLHKITVQGSGPHCSAIKCVKPVVHVLFKLVCAMSSTVSHLKNIVKEILTTFLKYQKVADACACFRLFTLGKSGNTETMVHPFLSFVPGSEGGMIVLNTGGSEVDWQTGAKEIVQLLINVDNDDLSAGFFIATLNELNGLVSREVDDVETPQMEFPAKGRNYLEVSDPTEEATNRIIQNLTLLTVIADMCEKLSHKCFKRKDHILDFVKTTLQRGVTVLENTDNESLSAFETEQLTLSMGLLTAVLSEPKLLGDDDRHKCDELLPLLQKIMDNHTNVEAKSMAADLRIAIATHGVVLNETAKKGSETVRASVEHSKGSLQTEYKQTSLEKKNDQKVIGDQTQRTGIPDKSQSSSTNIEHKNGKEESKCSLDASPPSDYAKAPDSAFTKALEELLDPLVPVRGHALITLRKLLENKHSSIDGKYTMLRDIFKENLNHDDTYIYLAAVQGMIALGDNYTSDVMPCLVQIYDNRISQQTISSELRVKVGEVIMRLVRSSGEMLPKYKGILLNAVLHVVSDGDPLVRSSALSNLAELCKLLHFSLGSVIQEVIVCISAIVKSDPEPQVRKSASMVMTLLLQGLGKDSIEVLGSGMRDLYHLLKHVATVEKDEGVQQHVLLALEEMDIIMKDFLFPKQTLSKNIHVRSAPKRMNLN